MKEKNDKTELTYFNHFKNCDKSLSLRLIPSGNTDPEGMLDYASKYIKRNIAFRKKDKALLFIDIDANEKSKQLKTSNFVDTCKGKNIQVIFSNPSFELWFLNHFELSKKEFKNQDELINSLKKHIENYQKNMDVFPLLPDVAKAVTNSKKQQTINLNIIPQNPGTSVYTLFDGTLEKLNNSIFKKP